MKFAKQLPDLWFGEARNNVGNSMVAPGGYTMNKLISKNQVLNVL